MVTASTVERTIPEVGLAPAQNGINSLLHLGDLGRPDRDPGYLGHAGRALPEDVLRDNMVLVSALGDALLPDENWPSFPAYVESLAGESPRSLRDRLLARVLTRSSTEAIDELLHDDPIAFQAALVNHLRLMWRIFLRPEWERVEPVLLAMLHFYEQRLASDVHDAETIRLVFGAEIDAAVQAARGQVVLVPSPHLGKHPCVRQSGSVTWIFFSVPEHPGLYRSTPVLEPELLARLEALNDGTRLRILTLLIARGEVPAQEIAAQLELSQPTASRHLKGLSSAGFLLQRRAGGPSKAYRVTPGQIELTFGALQTFLAGAGTGEAGRSAVDRDLARFLDDQGRLTTWPAKRKDQMVVLTYLAGHFASDRQYTEAEINEILRRWHSWNDPAELRRALFDDQLMDRTDDGSRYWRTE